MKQVIAAIIDPTPTVLLSKVTNEQMVYIAVGNSNNPETWILNQESGGWIFKYTSSQCGMSGHFSSMQDAISRAFVHGKVYEFDNHDEAFKFVFSQKKT